MHFCAASETHGKNNRAHRPRLSGIIFIYALEGYPDFQARITILLEAMDHQEIEALTSELTLAEVLVKPFRERNVAWQRTYQEVLQPSVNLRLLPVSRAILIAAAQVRAQFPIKLPDAIHAATAQQVSCGSFLTNDPGFKIVKDLPVVLLSEWQP
jgi:predicted nucleic acid-binding protein